MRGPGAGVGWKVQEQEEAERQGKPQPLCQARPKTAPHRVRDRTPPPPVLTPTPRPERVRPLHEVTLKLLQSADDSVVEVAHRDVVEALGAALDLHRVRPPPASLSAQPGGRR